MQKYLSYQIQEKRTPNKFTLLRFVDPYTYLYKNKSLSSNEET